MLITSGIRWIYCTSWDQLKHILWQTSKNTGLGELVQLCDYGQVQQHRSSALPLRRLTYKALDDIPLLIDPTSELSRLSTALSPRAISMGTALDANSEIDDSRSQVEISHIDGATVVNETLENSTTQTKIITPTAEEQTNARLIQTHWRSAMQRQKDREATKGIAATRGRLFLEYFSRSKAINWGKRSDRHVFLGALPHILLSVDWVMERAKEMKELAKKRREGASYRELEQAMELQTKARQEAMIQYTM